MSALTDIPEDIGLELTRLRLNAGLKQSKVAQLMDVDTSRISRVETGEANPSNDEIAKFAMALDTDEARDYLNYLGEAWTHIEKPAFWHPARRDLREIEAQLVRLESFVAELGVSSGARAEANMHRKSLQVAATYLQGLDHSLVFVGDIGVGKSTAICSMMNLLVNESGKKPLRDKVVLETGAGGTTVCEVHIRPDGKDSFGLLIQTHSEEELFRTVSDFCASLIDSQTDTENGVRGVSQEINRAIRNMSGLVRSQSKGADGKVTRIDPAADLARSCNNNLQEFTAEVYRRIKVEQRTQTEARFQDNDHQAGLKKLRQLFSDVNNGKCPEISLPRRIDLIAPIELLGAKNYRIRVVDTKGVDGTAIRPDIRAYLDDPRSLTVLCTRYNSAPDSTMQALVENLVVTGADHVLRERVTMLVLPRDGEALDMRDDSGQNADTAELGYRLKEDQIAAKLGQQKGGEQIPIIFFDVLSDDPTQIARALAARVEHMRALQSRRVEELSNSVTALLKANTEERTMAAQREVRRRISIFLRHRRQLPDRAQAVHGALISALQTTNARTIWASARRNGSWPGMDAYHFLGVGAAIDAQLRSQAAFSGLDELLLNMHEDEQLAAARDYIAELRRNIPSWKTSFLTDVTSSGREQFRSVLWLENELWNRCANRWGGGPGYRDNVSDWIRSWFDDAGRTELHGLVERRVQAAWENFVIGPIAALCQDEKIDESRNFETDLDTLGGDR